MIKLKKQTKLAAYADVVCNNTLFLQDSGRGNWRITDQDLCAVITVTSAPGQVAREKGEVLNNVGA
jgi:hypothetical protein